MYDKTIKMSLKDNIFLAKRDMADSIRKSLNLEGYAVTFPETSIVFDGFSVDNMAVDLIIAISNLKRAWYFIIDNIDFKADIRYISQVNKIIKSDEIVGTNWITDTPNLDKIHDNLANIMSIEDDVDRALKTMIYLMKSHFFINSNKITSQLIANQILIQNGRGIVSIPIEIQDKFRKQLVEFYETNNDKKILETLKNYCLKNMDLSKDSFIELEDWKLPKNKGRSC